MTPSFPTRRSSDLLAGRIEAERRGWLRRRHGGGGYESALACFQMGMGGLADKPCRTRVDRKYLVELCKAKINQRSAHDDAGIADPRVYAAHVCSSEERRVGKACVGACKSGGSP